MDEARVLTVGQKRVSKESLQGMFKLVNIRISKAFMDWHGQSSQHRSGVTVERYHRLSHDTLLLLEF
jgi:hypothetical protein